MNTAVPLPQEDGVVLPRRDRRTDPCSTMGPEPAASHGSGAGPYTLLGADGVPHRSATPGAFGGHRGTGIYGRLDCPSARRALDRGGYVRHRVFFADELTAIGAGFRPCAVCMPDRYRAWKRGLP